VQSGFLWRRLVSFLDAFHFLVLLKTPACVVTACRYYESLGRRTYITPTSYLELIKTFKRLLEKKRLELLTFKNRYLNGLEKLDFAQSQINHMQQDLTALQPLLEHNSAVIFCCLEDY